MRSNLRILFAIFLGCMGTASTPAFAQGTAFTYQGRLNSGVDPANGSYDFEFTLFSTNSNGAPIAGAVTNLATTVSNGLFTATVDFGPGIFAGNSSWVEIAVRTNGGTGFTLLTPRQQLTPAPYAIFANTASNLTGTLPASQLSGNLPASQLSGTIQPAQFAGTYSNPLTLNNPANSFSGNGGGLTNLSLSGIGPAGTFSLVPIYFAPPQFINLPFGPSGLVTADVNGDGKTDLAIILPTFTNSSGAVLVFTNNGKGSLICASTNVNPNGLTVSAAFADFNQDGKMDLAAGDDSIGVMIFKGNGDGTFNPVLTNNLGFSVSGPRLITAAMLNADIYPDLVVFEGANPTTMRVLANFGGGAFAFTQVQSLTINDAVNFVTSQDINGDGQPDIIYTAGSGGIVMTNHNGLLTAASTNSAGQYGVAYGVAVGDVNGDARPDLVMASPAGNIFCYTNAGAGVFGSNSTTHAGSTPISLVAITNNLGAVTEISTLNGQDGSISVLTNDGRGNFTLTGTAPVDNSIYPQEQTGIATFDLNGDGNADFFVADLTSTDVVELLAYRQTLGFQNPLVMTNAQNSIGGYFFGNGAALSNLNASQISSGTLSVAQLPPNIAFLNSNQTFTGTNIFNSANNIFSGNFFGTSALNSFTGKGGGLTALNASQLTSGTVPLAVLSSLVETNGGDLRVGTNGTIFTQVEFGQATMPPSSLVATNLLITFPKPFTASPKITTTIAFGIQGAPDVYAICVSSNSTTAFRINVMRLDAATGWGQNLLINWQAWQ